jgi:hypothetical protein
MLTRDHIYTEGITMPKQAARLFAPLVTTVLATISITACVDNNNTSSQTTEPTAESTAENKATQNANLIKATKAAIVMDSYDAKTHIGTHQVTPANNSSTKSDHER